jgi:hypothetical protein
MEMTLIIVTVVSLLVAAVMSVITWRLLRNERLRSSARVAALAAEIHDTRIDTAIPVPARDVEDDFVLRRAPAGLSNDMFAHAPQRSRWPVVVGIALLVVGVLAAAMLVTGGGNRGDGGDEIEAQAAERPRGSAAAPLELVALGHERDSDGVTVRGVLRNPAGGAELSHLSAVVLLFNRDGRYIATGRAPVQAETLGPGGETTFVVTVSGAPDVERYRVSFRTQQDVVPHVDHRT